MWLFGKKRKFKKLIACGDKALDKNKFKKALKYYKKALKINPEDSSLYPKLIKARESIEDEWTQKDFVEFMEWSLAEQGNANPSLKQIYARLSPEWQETWELAVGLITANKKENAGRIEELVKRGEMGTRVLAEMILQLTPESQEISPNV